MKRFEDYSWEVRGEAIRRLREERGICTWHVNFDTNSPEMQEMLVLAETGEAYKPKVKVEKAEATQCYVSDRHSISRQRYIGELIPWGTYKVLGSAGLETRIKWKALSIHGEEMILFPKSFAKFWLELTDRVAVIEHTEEEPDAC